MIASLWLTDWYGASHSPFSYVQPTLLRQQRDPWRETCHFTGDIDAATSAVENLYPRLACVVKNRSSRIISLPFPLVKKENGKEDLDGKWNTREVQKKG